MREARRGLLVVVVLGLSWLLVALPVAAAPELTVGETATVVATGGTGVRVRSGPGVSYQVVGELPEGSAVRLLAGPSPDGDVNWYQVKQDGDGALRGWVSGVYLLAGPRPTVKESALVGARKLAATVSSYASVGGIGFYTATGTRVHWGTVAVDPRVIPLGSQMLIEGLDGIFVAEDTGGGVIGNFVDVWFPDLAAALRWGTQQRTVTILREGY